MSKVYRAGKCLTDMNDKWLNAMVVVCVARGIDFDDISKRIDNYSGRKTVRYATAAIDLLTEKLTVTHVIAPSPESALWSNMEGGHRYHELPDIETLLFK